jgi:hypothetical protein
MIPQYALLHLQKDKNANNTKQKKIFIRIRAYFINIINKLKVLRG